MADVFISYARSSEGHAKIVAERLRERGFDVWLDFDLPTHRVYADVIAEQLASAKAVVVIWSDEAVKSQWVRSEADRARAEDKLVQLIVDGARLPMPFDQIQCANLSGWTGDAGNAGWLRIVDSVQQLIGSEAPALTQPVPVAPTGTAEQQPTLAVLPFDNPTLDAELEALCDGIGEDVVRGLMEVSGVGLIGRTASLQFRGEMKARAGESLKATHLVDGSIRRAGQRVRINVHLTHVASGAAVWSERFDRDLADVFALQDEVSGLIVPAMRLVFDPSPSVATAAVQAVSVSEAQPAGERRHLTILSCAFAKAEQSVPLDAELWHTISAQVQPAVGQAIIDAGGVVTTTQRDGLLACFGYPQAQEDAAERAVRAGLAILEAMSRVNQDLPPGVCLVVRIGVHAGTVVVGGSAEVEIFGEAPAVAVDAQAAAQVDTLVASHTVHQLTSGLFVMEPLKLTVGGGEPVALYRVVRGAAIGARARGFSSREATRFVGREEELQLLLSRWERVRDGEGQVVLVLGEPGIGKTRLLDEFRGQIEAQRHSWIECGGAPFFVNTPFYATTQMLRQGLGLMEGDDLSDDAFDRVRQGFAPDLVGGNDIVPLVAEVLGLSVPKDYPPLQLAPDRRRRQLLSALTAWVFNGRASTPLVLVVEDLHWIDPSTLEMLQTLVDQGATAPVLLIGTARPEFRPTWTPRGHHAQITLNRLNSRQTRELVMAAISEAGLADGIIDAVVMRTDGVPLFAEELTRLILDGQAQAETHNIPPTLLDSLATRLDRLGRAKQVAQLASVLGREFSYELLHAVSPAPEAQLQADLESLVDAELIYARGTPPEASYRFKHALMQDAAYMALLKSRRRELHGRVARTLAAGSGTRGVVRPEVLARHWTEAGETAAAIAAWKAAGEEAVARRAFKEAEFGYRQAVDLISGLPQSNERDAIELELQGALNRVLQLTLGYAAPDTMKAAARSRALAEKTGSVAQLIREELRVWRSTFTAGDYAAAARQNERILQLAEREPDRHDRIVVALHAEVQGRFYTGDLKGADEHFERLSPMIDPVGQKSAQANNLIAIGVASLAAWVMGRSDVAEARLVRARSVAEATGNPYDFALTLHFHGVVNGSMRKASLAQDSASQLLILCEENGFAYLGDLARGTLGSSIALLGQVSEGVGLLRRALLGFEVSGARVGITYFIAQLSAVLALSGELDEAFSVVNGAINDYPQELAFRPEALRLRGSFHLAQNNLDEARKDFVAAIDLAREIGAKAWSLRTTTDLARLAQSQGDDTATTNLLVPLLQEFPQAEMSVDLTEARAVAGAVNAADRRS